MFLSPKARIIALASAVIMLELFIAILAVECWPRKDTWIAWILGVALIGTFFTAAQQFKDIRKEIKEP